MPRDLSQRASQKPSRPRLEGDNDAFDLALRLGRFLTLAMQEPQQPILIRRQLLQGVSFNARQHSRDKPARLTHLDNDDDCAFLAEGGDGPAQIV
jgi:hypothetical protein